MGSLSLPLGQVIVCVRGRKREMERERERARPFIKTDPNTSPLNPQPSTPPLSFCPLLSQAMGLHDQTEGAAGAARRDSSGGVERLNGASTSSVKDLPRERRVQVAYPLNPKP